MNAKSPLGQGVLSFARAWELPPLSDPCSSACEHVRNVRGQEQLLTAALTGLSEVADVVQCLCQSLDKLSAQMTSVESAVRARAHIDDEVRRYRNAEHRTDALSFFMAIIGVLDRIAEEETQVRQFENHANAAQDERIRQALRWVGDARKSDKVDLRNLLTSFGVEWFAPQPGEPFDPKRHKFAGSESHADPKLHGCIQGTRRYGYWRRHDDWVVRPAAVVVFRSST